MRRKRQRISVTLAVLVLGLVIGWIAGERAPSPKMENAWVQQETTFEAEGHANPVRPRLNHVSAFRMPYFSFKAVVQPLSAGAGQQP